MFVLSCCSYKPPINDVGIQGTLLTSYHRCHHHHPPPFSFPLSSRSLRLSSTFKTIPHAYPPNTPDTDTDTDINSNTRFVLQSSLWLSEAVYILWLFLLPFAPGDPVWAISSQTLDSLLSLSLNFFLILPLLNAAGIHVVKAPLIHPMSEGLFNFVIGWTFMFAPLLFTDHRRDRYKASLGLLWGLQMFLTNTFLIPYMAIRLNEADPDYAPQQSQRSWLESIMTSGADIVGFIGGFVCLASILWGLFGRAEANFGGIAERWDFLITYLGSERLAYAFIWDIFFYTIFQPWLIDDNLRNIEQTKAGLVNYLRFIPVVGLVAYLVCLNRDDQP